MAEGSVYEICYHCSGSGHQISSTKKKVLTRAEIISDEEAIRVHGNANFGKMLPREVIDEALEQVFAGFHTGSTARAILSEHGLAKNRKDLYKAMKVTKKGIAYMKALTRERILAKT